MLDIKHIMKCPLQTKQNKYSYSSSNGKTANPGTPLVFVGCFEGRTMNMFFAVVYSMIVVTHLFLEQVRWKHMDVHFVL